MIKMNEEIKYILETLSFKTSIYRDKYKRNLSFNDDEYYSNVLYQYITQLQNNWNELKKYISAEWYCFDNESVEFEVARKIIKKAQELEQGKDE